MILPIVKEPDKILHSKAITIKEVTPDIRRLVQDMVETMYAAEGVGLAANQVASPLNILVASADGKRGKEVILLNAKIIERKGKMSRAEGCLSVPGVASEGVKRAAEVTVAGLDLEKRPQTLQATGLLAQILQHEVDHLEGHLYLDRLGLLERQTLVKKYNNLRLALGEVKL